MVYLTSIVAKIASCGNEYKLSLIINISIVGINKNIIIGIGLSANFKLATP